jgi:hypothetical protein
MHKKSREEALNAAYWAEKRWQMKLVRASKKDKGYSHDVIRIVAPEILSFHGNSRATLRFFEDFKEAVFTAATVLKKGKAVPKPVSLELSTIRSISLPSAVILAAELHRWALSQKTSLKLHNHNKWDKRVRGLMRSLGVFDLVGIKNDNEAFDPQKEVILLQLQSDTKRDGAVVDKLQRWMRSMELGFSERKYVFGALDEAIINGFEHAYIDTGSKPRFPYVGHRWWATSCYDPTNHSLRFFVYDQGRGIPATLPSQSGFWSAISSWIDKIPGTRNEADLIEAAFTVGKTRTHVDERGKGLSKMREAIELAGDGYLRILSGRGDITLGPHATLKKIDHISHIGGTLVEWSIPIVALQDDGPNNG